MFYLYLLHNSSRYLCHLMNYWPTIWVYPWPSNKCQCCSHWYKGWINVLDMARTIRQNQRVWNGKKLDNLLNINSFRHWYVVNISIMTYLLPTRKWRLDTYYFLKIKYKAYTCSHLLIIPLGGRLPDHSNDSYWETRMSSWEFCEF